MSEMNSQEKASAKISPPIKGDDPPDREFYFKSNPEKKAWKAPYGVDLYYTKEGQYRLYQTIDPSELEEAEWSKAYSKRFSRREFLRYGGAFTAGIVLSSTLLSYFFAPRQVQKAPVDESIRPAPVLVASYPRVWITKLSQLVEGKPLDFSYPLDHFNDTNFIVKLGKPAIGGVGPGGDIVAFNYMCTHMGCPLIGMYKHEYNMLGPCPCHFTRFDLTKNGMVIIGQATQNLPQILLEVEGDDIYATGVMRLIYGFRSNLSDAEPLGAV